MRSDARRAFAVVVAVAVLAPWTAAPAQEKAGIDLRLRLKKGDAYRVTETSDTRTTSTVGDRETTQHTTAVYTMTFTVEDVDARGNATIRQTYDAVRVHDGGPDGRVVYDSAKPRGGGGGRATPEAAVHGARLGSAYAFTIKPDGKVTGGEVVPKAGAARQGGPARGKPMGEVGLKEWEQTVGAFRRRDAASAGESWQEKAVPTADFQTTMDVTYTLKGTRDGAAEVEMTADERPDPRAKPATAGALKMESRFTGRRRGTVRLDPATGWPRSVEVKRNLEGVSTMTTGGRTVRSPTKIDSKIVWQSEPKQ